MICCSSLGSEQFNVQYQLNQIRSNDHQRRERVTVSFPDNKDCAQHWVIHHVTFDPKNYIKKMRQLAKKHSAGMAAIFKTIHGRL